MNIDSPVDIKTNIDVDGGKLIIERVADVQPVLDEVAKLKSAGRTKTAGGDHHLGKIPGIIIEQYCNSVGITFHDFCVDDTHITRILNDPDYKQFRIMESRV